MEKYKDEDWLRRKYIDEGKTMAEIGEIVNRTGPTISYWIDKQGIKTRDEGNMRPSILSSSGKIKIRMITSKHANETDDRLKGREAEKWVANHIESNHESWTVVPNSTQFGTDGIVPKKVTSKKGSPDLLAHRDGTFVRFIEVKVTNGLSIDQVKWIVKYSVEYPVEVVWVDITRDDRDIQEFTPESLPEIRKKLRKNHMQKLREIQKELLEKGEIEIGRPK